MTSSLFERNTQVDCLGNEKACAPGGRCAVQGRADLAYRVRQLAVEHVDRGDPALLAGWVRPPGYFLSLASDQTPAEHGR